MLTPLQRQDIVGHHPRIIAITTIEGTPLLSALAILWTGQNLERNLRRTGKLKLIASSVVEKDISILNVGL